MSLLAELTKATTLYTGSHIAWLLFCRFAPHLQKAAKNEWNRLVVIIRHEVQLLRQEGRHKPKLTQCQHRECITL